MKFEVKVPAVGESVTEATIGSWLKKSGEAVQQNDVILSLETDKASVEVVAEKAGTLEIKVEAGQVIPIGTIVGFIDTDKVATTPEASSPRPAAPAQSSSQDLSLSPAVQRIVTENNLDPSKISGTGKDGRLTKGDVLNVKPSSVGDLAKSAAAAFSSTANALKKVSTPGVQAPSPAAAIVPGASRRVPMTSIRKKIAERLVEAKNSTAMLTTFNEIDMTRVMELRTKYKDQFKEKYGVGLGFMGFFTKAVVEGLKAFPAVNAYIIGTDLEYHDFYNIGIAVSTERGLMVPVIRNVDQMSVAQIEMAIRDYALKARDGKIGVDDLQGGTFTITNGGVFGSLMSTPILNPPQSAILGMHKIEERPIAIKGEVVVRPMMYVAISYDHRVIDGKESVSFLVKVKEAVEDPERLLIGV